MNGPMSVQCIQGVPGTGGNEAARAWPPVHQNLVTAHQSQQDAGENAQFNTCFHQFVSSWRVHLSHPPSTA